MKQIKSGVAAAKRVGKAINKLDRATNGALQMIPYVPQSIRAANSIVAAADGFADLMSSFGFGGVSHPGITNGETAGVSNNIPVVRSKPKFRSSKGTIRIMHKELVCTVTSSASLATTPTFSSSGASIFQVNALCSTAFPWLSSIAANYDEYKFNRVRLVYVPFCATSQVGRVMVGYDQDSTDALPADRQALSNTYCSTEGASWGTMVLDLELSDTNKWYYCNNTGANSDVSAYLDQGQFFTATWSGSNTDVGELYVLYDVSLKSPQPSAGVVFQALGTGASVSTQFPSNSPPFASSTSTSIVAQFFTPGDYMICLKAAATAFTAKVFGAGASNLSSYEITDATHVADVSFVRLSGVANGTVTWGGLTALGNWELYVTRVPRYSTYTFA